MSENTRKPLKQKFRFQTEFRFHAREIEASRNSAGKGAARHRQAREACS